MEEEHPEADEGEGLGCIAAVIGAAGVVIASALAVVLLWQSLLNALAH